MRLKRLELWWRALWIRILVRLMRRPAERPPGLGQRAPFACSFSGTTAPATWSFRPASCAPSRDRIRRSRSTCSRRRRTRRSSTGADYVDRVIVFDKKRLGDYLRRPRLRLRRARYDAVVDCMVTAPSVTTLLLILASGAELSRWASRDAATTPRSTSPFRREARAGRHMVDLLAALARASTSTAISVERRPSGDHGRRARTRRRASWANVQTPTGRWSRADQRFGGIVERDMARRTLRRGDAALRERHSARRRVRVIGAPSESDARSRHRSTRRRRVRGHADAFATRSRSSRRRILCSRRTRASRTPRRRFRAERGDVRARKADDGACTEPPGENVQHPDTTLATLAVDPVWPRSIA